MSKKRWYRLRRLPNYLILHLSRFKKNGFFMEKNPTIVMFPVKNFDLSSYVFPEGGRERAPTEEEVKGMSVSSVDASISLHIALCPSDCSLSCECRNDRCRPRS